MIVLRSNEESIRRYDLEYTRLGIQYHRIPPDTRDHDLTLYNHFVVTTTNGITELPQIIKDMREHAKAVRRAKRLLHGGVQRLTALIDKTEDLRDAIHDMIAQIRREIVPVTMQDRRERSAIYRPELMGYDRILAIGNRGDGGQRDAFHDWAMELKEVKAAIRLGRLVEDDVDEFVSNEDERFTIEDTHDPEEEDEEVGVGVATSVDEEQDPDQRAVREMYGPGAAVRLT